MIDIDSDIPGSAGDITSRKDITRPLVIAGVDDITENRPMISLPSDITGEPPTISLASDITGHPGGDIAGQ